MRHFKIREMIEHKMLVMKYMTTVQQLADSLTKNLNKVTFARLTAVLMGESYAENGDYHVRL